VLRKQGINGKLLLIQKFEFLLAYGIRGDSATVLFAAVENQLKKPKEKPLPQFSPAKYSFVFPTFEPNDDELPLLDRDDQIKVVANTIQGLGHAPKYEPIVICTSRSMGKTFFMKKLVKPAKGYSPVKQIKDAYEVGHIVTMNTTEIYHVLANDQDNYSRFWQLAIAYNIVHLFAGYQVARINFHICNLADIIGCWKKLERRDNALLKYLSGKLIGTSVRGACQEMVRLTNIAFASNSDVKPVFLLDNVHTLARLPTTLLSTKNKNQTILSMVLNQLAEYRPPCIVAGTTDGFLNLVVEYSNLCPVYVNLKPLTVLAANEMANNIISLQNRKNHTSIACLREEDHLFIAMTYEACQIPRLLKIGYQTWYKEKCCNYTDAHILESFYSSCQRYYSDAISFITEFKVREAAILILCCSVNFKLAEFLPSTRVPIKDLIDRSIIFPYLDDSYVIPAFFWLGLNETSVKMLNVANSAVVLSQWAEVQKEMQSIIPGFNLEDLYIYSKRWLTNAFSISHLGTLWEKLVSTSLATKYVLHSLETTNKTLPLCEFYYLSKSAQAYPILEKFSASLSNGIITPSDEVTVNDTLNNAVYHNLNVQNAHHDIILCASPHNIAIQCKNSLADPKGDTVKKQLTNCTHLLWFYPGFDEEDTTGPKDYRTRIVKDAIEEKKLGFLNGAGCVSLLTIDMVLVLKRILLKKNSANPPLWT